LTANRDVRVRVERGGDGIETAVLLSSSRAAPARPGRGAAQRENSMEPAMSLCHMYTARRACARGVGSNERAAKASRRRQRDDAGPAGVRLTAARTRWPAGSESSLRHLRRDSPWVLEQARG